MLTFLTLLASTLALGAETPERLYDRAVQNFSESRYDSAASLLLDAVSQRPRWFEARLLLGASLVSLGRTTEAIEQLKAAHRLNPRHVDCVKLLAAEYLGVGRTSEALLVLRPLVSQQPDEELLLLAIEALQVRGDAGDADEAMRLSKLGVARYPRSPRLLAWHGYALREMGSMAEARKSFEAALALAPDDIASKAMLADVIRTEGRHPEALRLFNEVLAHAPADEEALVGKSRTLVAMERLQDAVATLRTAVRAAPEIARLRLELSQLYAKLGDRDGATREAAEFRRLRGSNAKRSVPASLRSSAP